MQIAHDLMHVFMKENELKEKTKKLLDKAEGWIVEIISNIVNERKIM